MSTRKIKNARDLESNELIYFKSHAQATFMSDGSTVEDVINEIKETGGADLTDYVTTTQLNTSLSGKQDTISDLADIRSGASKGATAVQPASVATAVTINGVNKTISSNKINIGTIPTAVTINGSTKTGSTIALGTVVTGVTMNGSAKTISNGKVDLGTIITAHQTLKTINGESIIGSGNIEISGGGGSSDVCDPSIIYFDMLQFENTEWIDDYGNITANGTISQGEYDLFYTAALENNKLGLSWDSIFLNNLYAESFSYNWFTVFAIFYDEGNNILKYVRVNFNSDLNVYISTGIIETGTAGSGTNIITSVKINNVSKTPSNGVVDLGYINKQLSTTTSSSMSLSPNIYYRNTSTSLSSLTITLGSVSNSNIINEYFVEFTTRSSGTTVSLPSGIKWMNGVTPTFEASTTYQISIVNNLGTWVKFK